MTGFFFSWIALVFVQTAVTMYPGPAFFASVRNSLRFGRRTGVFTAVGLGLGVGFHAVLVMCGLAVLIKNSVFLYSVLKYLGAAYLIYIGVSALRSSSQVSDDLLPGEENVKVKDVMAPGKAVLNGFLTNALNPKAVLFFTAVFTQFIFVDTTGIEQMILGLTSVAIEIIWFAALALFLTHPVIMGKIMKIIHQVERCCGGLMIALGLKLAVTE